MYQQVTIIGRVGKDLEEKNGVGKFSVATSFKWTKDGAVQEKTTWFNCTLFGKKVGGVGKYIKKGGMVHVTGRIETSEYQGKSYWSLNVNEVTLLSKPDRADRTDKPLPNLDDIPF